jgi:hypothetical protein
VGPRAVLDAVVKRKIPSPRQDSNPRTAKSVCQFNFIILVFRFVSEFDFVRFIVCRQE